MGCMLIALGGALLIPLATPQDPKPTSPPVWNDATTRKALEAFNKTVRNKRSKPIDRLQTVANLEPGRNKLLVPVLAKIVHTDSEIGVRTAAAQLLAKQPKEQAHPVILTALRQPKQPPRVAAALVDSLSVTGYGPRDWREIEPLFTRRFDSESVVLQQAILRLVATTKEKQAWRMLVRQLDEPHAAAPGPNRRPAHYWVERRNAWRAWRSGVQDALFALTRQRFTSGVEAHRWIIEHGAKLGLR